MSGLFSKPPWFHLVPASLYHIPTAMLVLIIQRLYPASFLPISLPSNFPKLLNQLHSHQPHRRPVASCLHQHLVFSVLLILAIHWISNCDFLEICIFLFNFIYLFLAVLGLHCYTGFSLVAVSGGYSVVAVCELFLLVACLLWNMGSRACGLSNCGTQAQQLQFPGSKAQD